MKYDSDKYFATLDTEQIGDALADKITTYYQYLQTTGVLNLWQNSYDRYYSSKYSDGHLYVTGEQGEYVNLTVNHYANILKHLKRMTLQMKPAFQAMAANSDARTTQQCVLANNLLEYFMREKALSKKIIQAVEFAVLFGEGFIETLWDVNAGEPFDVDPETGVEIKSGDMLYHAYSPMDVIRNPFLNSFEECQWFITRKIVNRYDIIAENPDLEDKILSVGRAKENESYAGYFVKRNEGDDDENIYLYRFYHMPSASVPDGRITEFVDHDIILYDGSLPYEKALHQIRPDNRLETPFGYSPAFDLLPIQEMLDALYSTIGTNQATFGVQSVLVERGGALTPEDLAKGLRVIYYNRGEKPPTALNLASTPAEVFKFLRELVHDLETISGVNSVTRGNPEASLKSGAALALVASQAIQFSQDLQQSYSELLQDVGTATINILKNFAQAPRIAKITGKRNQSYIKEFKGDDLHDVNLVQVDIGNPLMRTVAGRTELAQILIQNGMIDKTTPDQFLQVIETGRLEPLTQSRQHDLMNIQAENEALMAGNEVVNAIFGDDHLTHVREHVSVLSSLDARKDPELITRVQNHVMQHIELLKTTDPDLLAMLGQQSLQAQPIPPQGAMDGGQAMQGEPQGMMDAQNPVLAEADKVNMPNMPNNPLTGEQFDNQTGGL